MSNELRLTVADNFVCILEDNRPETRRDREEWEIRCTWDRQFRYDLRGQWARDTSRHVVVGKGLPPLQRHASEWVRDWVRVIAALHHAIEKVEKPLLDGIRDHATDGPHQSSSHLFPSSLFCFLVLANQLCCCGYSLPTLLETKPPFWQLPTEPAVRSPDPGFQPQCQNEKSSWFDNPRLQKQRCLICTPNWCWQLHRQSELITEANEQGDVSVTKSVKVNCNIFIRELEGYH